MRSRPVLTRRAAITAALGMAAFSGPAHTQAGFAGAIDAARALEQLRAIVIAEEGRIVAAEAVRGPGLDTPVNVKSVSKTLVAAVLGAAIDRGAVPGLQAKLGEVAPGLIPPGADPRVADLTLEHLVTMQAGLERTSGGNYGAWVSSPDWVAYALSRDFVAEPGTRMLYSTGSFHVLGAALSVTTGRSLHALTRDWIGDPLGIDVPRWIRDPQGFYLGGNDMALSPLALVRFGEMYRQGGTWDGQRVLSRGWVRDSFRARGRSPWSGMGYGLGWFLGRAGGVDYALARGYGGQVVAVVPDRALTVAITSDPTRPARSDGYFGDLRRLIESRILAAA